MSPLYVDMLMGHKSGLKHVYFKPQWHEVLEGNDRMRGYISIINDLTINEENRLKVQVKHLKEEREILLTDIDRKIYEQVRQLIGQNGTTTPPSPNRVL
jgi:hypothetical protein